jgi:hypothetical protein
VTEGIARSASALFGEAGLHGHTHAIDAMVTATALSSPGPVMILTSDPGDLKALCGRGATVIRI